MRRAIFAMAVAIIGLNFWTACVNAADAYEYEYEGSVYSYVYMPWEFSSFAAPELDSEVLGRFAPQYIRYVEYYGDGWKAMRIRGELHWVYYRDEIVEIEIEIEEEVVDERRYVHIAWEFVTFAEPDFNAAVLGRFAPQYIRYVEDNGNGWKAMSISGQTHWVYSRANMQRLDRVMGLFNNMGDSRHVDLINPQVVRVLANSGRWLQISTYRGPRWVNLDFAPDTAPLSAALSGLGNRVSVFYKNIDSGFTFVHNPGRVFFGASTNKIYSALYIYTLAERGYIDLSEVHTYTAADHRGGSGRIQHMPFGTRFTAGELLNESIRYSCNVAYRMMALRYNHANFTFFDFVNEIGVNRANILSLTAKNIELMDAALWMMAIYDYIESGGRYSDVFRDDLVYAFGPINSDNHDVAQKYGWMDRNFHDMAIVYAQSPYILIILSDLGEDAGAGFGPFGRIGRVFEEFNDRYFR